MKQLIIGIVACAALLCSCHENMEKRAQREAREYTEKYCPTPVQNYTRTDSVVFDIDTKTYHYYCSITGDLDDQRVLDLNRQKISDALLANLKDNTAFVPYKKEGFAFQWTLRSDKDKNVVYFDKKFTEKEYK